MHRLLRIAIAAAVVLAVATLAHGQIVATNTPSQVTGTWVHQVQVGPGFSVPALVTLHFDGTVTAAGGLMFGGLPGATNTTGPVHGVWEKTGPKSVDGTTFYFNFDMNGVLIGYGRDRWSLTFGKGFMNYQGTEFLETVSCGFPLTCPDPLDPGTQWTALPGMPPNGYPVSGKRVQMAPAGPLP